MRRSHVVVGLLAATACRSRPSQDNAAATLDVRSGSAVVDTIPIADADLWHWCDEGVTSVVARARTKFVVGACAQRDATAFALTRASDGTAVATLVRSADKTVLARAQPVSSIEIMGERAAAPVSIVITIAGRPPVTLDAAALEQLLPPSRRREGVPLRAILDKVGVGAPRSITVRGETTYQVDPSWLATRTLTVRRNQRGALKLNDETAGVRVKGLTAIELAP
ncbi:MAG: hypothetical protein SFX73_29575 [Kofleriaceae bacterium]|nr:hypothetical protein [Kofleriaceae bacterium]